MVRLSHGLSAEVRPPCARQHCRLHLLLRQEQPDGRGNTMRVRVTINQEGRIVGEAHHRAKISDRLVQKLRDLNANWGLGWRILARQFELSPSTVKSILSYRRRNGIVHGYVHLDVADPEPPRPPEFHG